MDVKLLQDIGLSPTQASAYIKLVESGSSTAPALSKLINESRTNTYKLLDKLCELGLANKEELDKKLTYFPTSPAALESFLQKKNESLELQTRKLKAAMPSMLSYYLEHTEQPSVRYFQGKEGITDIYDDQLKEGKDIYLIRSWKDKELFGKGVYSIIRKRPAKHGITTHMLAPDVEDANNNPEIDKKFKYQRTWVSADAYSAPVEWNVYGDKTAIISFGTEAVGIVIESPQIAESMRQLFAIMSTGLKNDRRYKQFPKHARWSDEKHVKHTSEYKKLTS